MKNLVPKLETCKKLDEIGLFQESTFYWMLADRTLIEHEAGVLLPNLWRGDDGWVIGRACEVGLMNCKKYLPAPLAEEVLNEFTGGLAVDSVWHKLILGKIQKEYYVLLDGLTPEFTHKVLAEAASQMKIWLVENGYLKQEAEEMPLFKGTLEQLDNLTIT